MSPGLLDQLQAALLAIPHTPERGRFLVACSGGMDSVVLGYALLHLGYRFEVAHVNFGLRGEASDGDASFVRSLCETWGVTLHLKTVTTAPVGNVQAWARQLRYDFFHEMLAAHRLDYILTAHHLDDQIETMLLNFTRGSGVDGLAAMSMYQDQVVRPLLNTPQHMIAVYAQQHSIDWREDETNATDKYDRNKLRHHVLPQLAALRGHTAGMQKSLEHLRLTSRWLERHFANQLMDSKQADGRYTMPWHKTNDPLHHFERYQLLRGLGFHFDHVVQLSLSALTGSQITGNHYIATVDRDRLIVDPIKDVDSAFSRLLHEEDVPCSFKIHDSATMSASWVPPSTPAHESEATFDAAGLHWPLQVRSWQQGDRFQPLGMKGRHKKVSDLFVDLKVPLPDKAHQVIVADAQGRILWIAGLRRSRHSLVRPQTKRLLVLRLH